jgi:hypothetical protein
MFLALCALSVQIAGLADAAAERLVNRPAPGQRESMSTDSEPSREPGYVARRVSKGHLANASGCGSRMGSCSSRDIPPPCSPHLLMAEKSRCSCHAGGVVRAGGDDTITGTVVLEGAILNVTTLDNRHRRGQGTRFG